MLPSENTPNDRTNNTNNSTRHIHPKQRQYKNNMSSTISENNNNNKKQIPIVCPGHTRPLAEVQFCKADDRILLVSACHDKLPMLRDGQSGDWIGTWSGHKGAVWSCRLDRTANLAVTASGDYSVKVWDAITGQVIWTYPHNHVVKCCDFTPNSSMLATGGNEGILRIYNLVQQQENMSSDSKPVVPWEIPHEVVVGAGSNSKTSTTTVSIGKLNWLNDTIVFTGCNDGTIRFWDISPTVASTSATTLPPPPKPIHVLQVEDSAEIRDMELSTPSNTNYPVLTVAAGKHVYFFNLDTFTLIQSHTMSMIHFKEEGGASLHPHGHKFIAGGSDLWVRVFDYATGTELECLKGHHGPIRCLRYSPDGTTYATGSEDGTIRLWQDNNNTTTATSTTASTSTTGGTTAPAVVG